MPRRLETDPLPPHELLAMLRRLAAITSEEHAARFALDTFPDRLDELRAIAPLPCDRDEAPGEAHAPDAAARPRARDAAP